MQSVAHELDDIVPVVKIALAQLNLTLGDLAGNAARIVGAARTAQAAGASLLVTPELAICGYPPEDLLLREDFYRHCDEAVERVAREAPSITIVLGHPRAVDGRRYNAASVLRDGRVERPADRPIPKPQFAAWLAARILPDARARLACGGPATLSSPHP
jgi:hypothetical protein